MQDEELRGLDQEELAKRIYACTGPREGFSVEDGVLDLEDRETLGILLADLLSLGALSVGPIKPEVWTAALHIQGSDVLLSHKTKYFNREGAVAGLWLKVEDDFGTEALLDGELPEGTSDILSVTHQMSVETAQCHVSQTQRGQIKISSDWSNKLPDENIEKIEDFLGREMSPREESFAKKAFRLQMDGHRKTAEEMKRQLSQRQPAPQLRGPRGELIKP